MAWVDNRVQSHINSGVSVFMRIDREAFLVAAAALAGCQQDRSQLEKAKPVIQPPAATVAVGRPPILEPVKPPIAIPPPPPIPQPVAVRPTRQTPRQWFRTLTSSQREKVKSSCSDYLARECRASLRMAMPRPVGDPADVEKEIAAIAPEPVAHLPIEKIAAYCKNDFPPPSCETPLVIAFDSQPVEFAPAAGERFAFVPGAPMASDWPTASTPWIALDLDGDGAISSGAELFGSSTVLPGGARATNGFEALAALDANGDGVLDARDPMFAKLALWSDRNGDHRSSPDELRPLSSVVTRISLAYTRDASCNDRDDCEGERGTLHWTDAAGADHVGAVIDVYLPRK